MARDRRRLALVALVWLACVLAAACGGSERAAETVEGSTSVPTTRPRTTTTTAAPTTTEAPTTTASTAPPAPRIVQPAAPAPPPSPPARLIDEIATGGATRVITVHSPGWASTSAELILWEQQAGEWVLVGGPWDAWVGYAGWSYEPGEATGRTPIGSFTFGIGFGLAENPGYQLGWFVVGPTDYWVEDPSSPDYNTHVQGPEDPSLAPWGHFERLIEQPVAYQYSALINFNVPPSGPRGSGIFLHASKGRPTAGCVSLPVDELLTTLRWIDGNTRIVMAPDSEIRSL